MSNTSSDGSLVRPLLDRIADWLDEHVGKAGGSPATSDRLAELARTLGCELPAELVSVLRFERSLGVLEYSLIPPEQ
jgi:hypothetical protein